MRCPFRLLAACGAPPERCCPCMVRIMRPALLAIAAVPCLTWAQGTLPDQAGVPPGMIKIQEAPESPGPAFEALIKEMTTAFDEGQWEKSIAKAEAALKISERMVPLSTATQAACKLKDLKRANAFAARLKGIWRPVAGDLCIKDGVKLDGWAPMPPQPKRGYALLVDEWNEALANGDWKRALEKVEAALEKRPYETEPYVVGVKASCKLRDPKAANAYGAQLPKDVKAPLISECAKSGVKLDAATR